MEGPQFDFSTHKKARKALAIYETMGKGPRRPHKHSGRREMRALMESLQKKVATLPKFGANRQERRHGTKGWRSKHIW